MRGRSEQRQMYARRLFLVLCWLACVVVSAQRSCRPVVITTPVEGARVFVDGREVGRSPYRGILSVDEHRIYAVQNDGLSSEVVRIRVEKGLGMLPEIRLVFHVFVDMGLPSGTLWATCNVGAARPEDAGDFFAWSEVRPVGEGTSENFVFKSEWLPEDDAATANWGRDWCMPTLEQLTELVDARYTRIEWVNREGTDGLLVRSRRNGRTLFLPAAGCSEDGQRKDVGAVGYYWSQTAGTTYENGAYQLYFVGDEVHTLYCDRFYGRSVRAVRRE